MSSYQHHPLNTTVSFSAFEVVCDASTPSQPRASLSLGFFLPFPNFKGDTSLLSHTSRIIGETGKGDCGGTLEFILSRIIYNINRELELI